MYVDDLIGVATEETITSDMAKAKTGIIRLLGPKDRAR